MPVIWIIVAVFWISSLAATAFAVVVFLAERRRERMVDAALGPLFTEAEVFAAVKCVDDAQSEDPRVTVWAVFSHLDRKCSCFHHVVCERA